MEARNTNNATVSDLVYSLLGLELKIDTQGQPLLKLSDKKIPGKNRRSPINTATVSDELKQTFLGLIIPRCHVQKENGTCADIGHFFSPFLQQQRIDSPQTTGDLEKILKNIYKKNPRLFTPKLNSNVQDLIFNILVTIGKIIFNIYGACRKNEHIKVDTIALHLLFEYLAKQWGTSAVVLSESYYLYNNTIRANHYAKQSTLVASRFTFVQWSPVQPLPLPSSGHDSQSPLTFPKKRRHTEDQQKKNQESRDPKKRKTADIPERTIADQEVLTDEEESENTVEQPDFIEPFIEPKENTADPWLDDVVGDQFLSIQYQINNHQLNNAQERREQLHQGIQVLKLEKKTDAQLKKTFEGKFQDLMKEDSVLCKKSHSEVVRYAQTQHTLFQRKEQEDEAKLEQYKKMKQCLETSYPESIPSPAGPSTTPFTKMNLFPPHVDFNAEAIQSLENGDFVYFKILVNNNQLTDPSLVFQSLDEKLTALLRESMDSICESKREKLELSKLLTGLIVSPDTLKSKSQRLSEIKQEKHNAKKQISNYEKALKLLREKYLNIEAAASFKQTL